jgi:hypothetical protein
VSGFLALLARALLAHSLSIFESVMEP